MNNQKSIYKLTSLWALAECGLGGIMHLFKIPFTGFFVGGFAVIIICLLAYFSNNSFKTILQATILVILVKAVVSPQSPPPAYFAVLFQGLMGAIIFSIFKFNTLSATIFTVISMIESSMQMVIIKTIFYGVNFWKAIDLFFLNILKEFHIKSDISFSFWLILAYVLLYSVWGFIIGFWASKMPNSFHEKWILLKGKLVTYDEVNLEKQKKIGRKIKWLGLVITVLFIITVLLFNGEQKQTALYVIIRTLLVVVILFFVVNPIVKYFLNKYATKHQVKIDEIINELPQLKKTANLAYKIANENKSGLAKYKEFVIVLITLTLYHEA